MNEHDSGRRRADAAVESLLAQWLARKDAGVVVGVEDLCRANPQYADDLRRMVGNLAQFDRAIAGPPRGGIDDCGAAFRRAASQQDRYETVEGIGCGAMGEVLAVRDRILPRTLAMKVALDKLDAPSPCAASSHAIRRFLREAEILAELDHTGIVPVHDLGVRADGRPYFTMRRIKGRDLKAIFALVKEGRERWTMTRALDVLLRVCETMAFAHSRGVIHRDLKPANIMVGDFGEVYVVDWGLAKRTKGTSIDASGIPVDETAAATPRGAMDIEPTSAETGFGDVLGTLAYMPPEQARGATDELDDRADVYALGAMLYELLAGFAPYCEAGKMTPAPALRARIVSAAPRPLSALPLQAPPELAAITEKAMARELADRYADMSALAADLRAYLERRVVSAYETGAWAETKTWVRRNKALAGALIAVLVVAVAGAVAFQRVARREHARREELADSLSGYGTALRTSGRYDEALKALTRCIDLREQSATENPSNRTAGLALSQAQIQMGRTLLQSGKLSNATRSMRVAREGLEDMLGAAVDDHDTGVALVDCLVDFAKTLVTTARPQEVLELSDQAVDLAECLLEAYPRSTRARVAAAGAYLNRALQSVLEREPALVEADRDRAIGIYRDLLDVTPSDFDSKRGLVTALGVRLQPGGAPDPAEAARMDEALKLIAEMQLARPAERLLAMELIHTRDERGLDYLASDDIDRAQECFQANTDLLARLADQSLPDATLLEAQTRAWARLALVAKLRKNGPLMRDCAQHAVAGWRAITQGRDAQDVSFLELADGLNMLGIGQQFCSDLEAAKQSLGDAIAIRSRIVDASPDNALYRVQLHLDYTVMVGICKEANDEPAQLEWLARTFENFDVLKRLSAEYAAYITNIDELTTLQRTLEGQ